MIKYEEIISELDDNKVKDMLDKLGIPYVDKGSFMVMPTVCHNVDVDEASLKLYYYKNTHIFNCYTEDGAMSIFTFLKKYYETRDYEYDWYTDIYQLILGCSYFSEDSQSNKNEYRAIRENYTLKKDRKELPSYSEKILEGYIKYYPIEWLNDGISKAAMDKFHIMFSPPENKIIIPHYDVHERLIGIRGRALNQWEVENIGKYLPVQIEGKWYSHPLSLNLYGLNKTKENIKKTGIAFLFEAEKSVLQMESFNMLNCAAATCGNKLNKYVVDILIRECHPRELVLCFDKEQTSKHDETYFNKLYNMCAKYKNYIDVSFIYDKEDLLCLKDSPSDKGEEIFVKLLNKRIKI